MIGCAQPTSQLHLVGDAPSADILPSNWQLVSASDLSDYFKMRKEFYDSMRKSKKGEKLDGFLDKLRAIKRYIDRNAIDNWKRSVICGVFFLDGGLAINIQQLKLLLGKCKSSINGSLQQLGYVAQSPGSNLEKILFANVPLFHGDRTELKRWTIRDDTGKNELTETLTPSSQSVSESQKVPLRPLPPPPPPPAANLPIPIIKPPTDLEAVRDFADCQVDCPVKLKARIYSLLYLSRGIQTDD